MCESTHVKRLQTDQHIKRHTESYIKALRLFTPLSKSKFHPGTIHGSALSENSHGGNKGQAIDSEATLTPKTPHPQVPSPTGSSTPKTKAGRPTLTTSHGCALELCYQI